ncbi:hypothetical protein LN042_24000 [Kitasatospora sp. RB6PN24]|uniref:hypothetical protein n=1 Tax=Kitasatospora humi TaxID=2893891 RepID=UPI001E459B6E|nr:hypothetical protein [Kitasatospora humi]MCC9310093.1 hypothetical protein [Kitasatospora humi]
MMEPIWPPSKTPPSEIGRTRAAINVPLVAMSVLEPDLAEAASTTARSAYTMRAAQNQDELDQARAAAAQAADQLVARVGRHLA